MVVFFIYGMIAPFFLCYAFRLTEARTIESLSGVKIPLIPLHLLKNVNYVTMMICSSMGVSVFYALSILWPQQIVAIFGKTGTAVGWLSVWLSPPLIPHPFTYNTTD